MFRKRLDYLIIPDSGGKIKKERKKKAWEELHKREIGEVLIAKGKNSEEDILYLGKILRKGERIGIDTFPLHFKEYKEIIKKAIKQKKFPKGVKLENIKTSQSWKLSVYGFLGLEEEKLKKKVSYRKENFWERFKGLVKKILS